MKVRLLLPQPIVLCEIRKGISIVKNDERKVDDEEMFIRFVSGEIDSDSHVPAGLFGAAYDLIDGGKLSDIDYGELWDLMRWFRLHLKVPFDYSVRKPWRARRSICWFKSDAHEHVKHAWQLTNLLERNDVFMRMIKVRTAGYIIYEDDAQVLAQLSADMRRLF